MRAMLVGLALLAPAAFTGPASALSPGNTAIQTVGQLDLVQYREESRYCRRLRRACEYKNERGEAGEGNCRRYRRECR